MMTGTHQPTPKLPGSVLFCCTLNAIRSPMAEGLMRRLYGGRVFIDSVGTQGASAPDGFMVEVMREIGVDMSGHHPKSFAELQDDSFDVIIALSKEAESHARLLTRHTAGRVEFWDIADPSLGEGSRNARMAAYRQTRDTLQSHILKAFPDKLK